MNLFLKVKLSLKNFMWRSLNDYKIQSDENDLKIGQQMIVFFTQQCSNTSRFDCEKVFKRHSDTTLKHPPHSSCLAPVHFYLFSWLKMKLKGNCFVDSDEVIKNATKPLKDLTKN